LTKYYVNKPNRTVIIHTDGCNHIPKISLSSCGCGETGKKSDQMWFCEEHVTIQGIGQFMKGRQWAVLLCDDCFGVLPT
jgi:hypothetical protein